MKQITPLVAVAIQARLARMFAQDAHLDICDLDAMWKLVEAEVPSDLRATLRLQHCVKWTRLPEELRPLCAVAVARSFGWTEDAGREFAGLLT